MKRLYTVLMPIAVVLFFTVFAIMGNAQDNPAGPIDQALSLGCPDGEVICRILPNQCLDNYGYTVSGDQRLVFYNNCNGVTSVLDRFTGLNREFPSNTLPLRASHNLRYFLLGGFHSEWGVAMSEIIYFDAISGSYATLYKMEILEEYSGVAVFWNLNEFGEPERAEIPWSCAYYTKHDLAPGLSQNTVLIYEQLTVSRNPWDEGIWYTLLLGSGQIHPRCFPDPEELWVRYKYHNLLTGTISESIDPLCQYTSMFSSDGTYASRGHTLENCVTGETETFDRYILGMSGDARYLLLSDLSDNPALLLDRASGHATQLPEHNGHQYFGVGSNSISDNGETVIVGLDIDHIIIYDALNDRFRPVFIPMMMTSCCTSISADGRYLLAVSSSDDLVPGDDNNAADYFLIDWRRLQTISFEHEDYPTNDAWVPVPESGTIDGNPVRISTSITNSEPTTRSYTIDLVDLDTSTVITTLSTPLLAPDQSHSVSYEWDSTGYAWNSDGTPRAPVRLAYITRDAATGAEVSRAVDEIKIIPKPVVLLHGLWATHTAWTDFKGYLTAAHPDWRGFAVGDRQVVNGVTLPGEMDTGAGYFNLLPINSIARNAEIASAYIDTLREGVNAWQIDLVGHSMGGLIGRRYIQSYMNNPLGIRPVARNLVMLGTPNAGSTCAWFNSRLSTLELRPESMGRFNRTVTNRRGVNFFILAGDLLPINPCGGFRDEEALDYLTLFFGYSDTEAAAIVTALSGRNDNVVSVNSAFWNMTNSSRDILHGMHFSAFDVDWVYSQNAFTCFVKPRLALSPAGYPATIPPCESEPAPAPDEPASTVVYDQSFSSMIEVAANANVDVPFTVGSATHLSLTLLAAPEMATAIIAPDGSTAAQTAANSNEGSQGYRGYIIEAPAPGTWIARFSNTSAELSYGAVAAAEGGSTIDLDGAVMLTETPAVRVTAALTNAAVPITGATVTARLTNPQGVVGAPITLFDDGAHGDGASGDGVYSALTPALAAGTHAAQIDATGTGFTRTAILWVEIGASALETTVTLQGRSAADRTLPATVRPTVPGLRSFSGTVMLSNNGVFTLSGLADGEYTVRVDDARSLSACQVVSLTGGQVTAQLTLRAGDANEDNVVNITDFAILAQSFGKASAQPGFDGRVDFNEDGVITITDFSLLALNFGQAGCAA